MAEVAVAEVATSAAVEEAAISVVAAWAVATLVVAEETSAAEAALEGTSAEVELTSAVAVYRGAALQPASEAETNLVCAGTWRLAEAREDFEVTPWVMQQGMLQADFEVLMPVMPLPEFEVAFQVRMQEDCEAELPATIKPISAEGMSLGVSAEPIRLDSAGSAEIRAAMVSITRPTDRPSTT